MSRHSLFIFSSKENTIFLLKLAVLFAAVFIFFLNLSPQYLDGYNASLIDKVERLENIDEPKIVLIGNSNLAFGIKSEEIEKTFGMPVVNMGLHGGLGNVFHERMAELNVHKGDIYLVCHTSYGDTKLNQDLAWITIENHLELWKLLRAEDYIPMLKSYPAYLKKCILRWINCSTNQTANGVYSRASFNQYGDIKWEDDGLSYVFKEGDITVPDISDDVCVRLNELNHFLAEKGAVLLIAGYPIPENEFTPDKELYTVFQKNLEGKLNVPVISDFTDYIFPEDYFFDTVWHLNNIGKEARTRQLIMDLKQYLKKQERQPDKKENDGKYSCI